MKLLIVTAVEEYSRDVYQIFKQSGITSFSGSSIEGYKNLPTLLKTSNWFSGEQGGTESSLYFSFESEENVNRVLELVKEFNKNLDSNNPLRAIVLAVEKFI